MLDPKEERQYERLRKLARELHIPIPEAFIELEVFDKDGKLIQRHRQRSHSWTRNAYNMMFCQLAGKDADDGTFEAGKLSAKDWGGAIRSGAYTLGQYTGSTVEGTSYGYRAPATEDGKGIVVGSGTNAEDFEDYVLQTPIAEGTGAGQLNHVESEEHAISYSDTTLQNTLVRYLNNNSGGNIDVNEVALVGDMYVGGIARDITVSRDKLGATVTVPDTGQLKVTYTIQLTYPS